MLVYDQRLVRPTLLRLVQSLQEATALAANDGQRLRHTPEDWSAFVTKVRPEAEGIGRWVDPNGAGLVLAWWTDQLDQRHFRVWVNRQQAGAQPAPFCAGPHRPALWHIYPDRLFVRHRRGQKEDDYLAVCACGACDTPRSLGWMGPCCRPCYDRRQRQPTSAREATFTLRAHTGPVRALAFSPDGRTLASAGEVGVSRSLVGEDKLAAPDDWGIRLWDVASGELLGSIASPEEQITALVFSPDGHTLASAGDARTLRLIDLATKGEWRSNQIPEKVRALTFAPDGLSLVLLAEGQLERWARATVDAPWLPVQNRGRVVSAIALSPRSGAPLAVGEPLGGVWLVSEREEEEQHLWRPLFFEVIPALAFTDGGRRLISLCSPREDLSHTPRRHTVQVWQVLLGEVQQSNAFYAPLAQHWTFSPDAHWLAGLGERDLALVEALKEGAPTFLAWAPDEKFACLAFSPDDEMLATGGEHGTVKLWPWRKLLLA